MSHRHVLKFSSKCYRMLINFKLQSRSQKYVLYLGWGLLSKKKNQKKCFLTEMQRVPKSNLSKQTFLNSLRRGRCARQALLKWKNAPLSEAEPRQAHMFVEREERMFERVSGTKGVQLSHKAALSTSLGLAPELKGHKHSLSTASHTCKKLSHTHREGVG